MSINASLPNNNSGLVQALQVIHETLSELGVEVVQTNLALMPISYYEGQRSAALDNIVKSIESANAVIIGTSVSLFGAGSAFAIFAEHLEDTAYRNCLSGKNCLLMMAYRSGSIRAAQESYARLLNGAGANDAVRIALRADMLGRPLAEDVRLYLERQTEDFYRISKANRKFYLPDERSVDLPVFAARPSAIREEAANSPQLRLVPEMPPEVLPEMLNEGAAPSHELLRKLGIDYMGEEQERDISEITQFFANKLTTQGQPTAPEKPRPKMPRVLSEELDEAAAAAPPPRLPTCRQLTQSLTHHFQPHMAAGITETIQFNISGDEGFLGYIQINNSECEFAEGEARQPDITILADSDTWKQVIKGKVTAQKAFMVGQLKVRGNFVLLSKFEQLFNTSSPR